MEAKPSVKVVVKVTTDNRAIVALMGRIIQIVGADLNTMAEKNQEYGESWKKRGGVGAFMMMARKWDRLEALAIQHGWDIFKAGCTDQRVESVLDDLKDLRNYLLLIDDYIRESKAQYNGATDDSIPLTQQPVNSDGPTLKTKGSSSAFITALARVIADAVYGYSADTRNGADAAGRVAAIAVDEWMHVVNPRPEPKVERPRDEPRGYNKELDG